MPYGTRRAVYVNIAKIPGLKYGFLTDIADTSSTKLGHTPALNAGDLVAGVMFGINSPKPPKAKKRFNSEAKNYESSFIASGSIDNARADGWKITPAKVARIRSTKYSKVVYVEYKIADAAEGDAAAQTINYTWRMPLYQWNKLTVTDKTTLGIKDLAATDDVNTLVVGANNPKPSRAVKTVTADNVPITISTFVSTAKADSLDNGWSLA